MKRALKLFEGQKERKIGVFICRCGGNISGAVDVDRLKEYSLTLPGVKACFYQSFTCSVDGQQNIVDTIKENGLDSAVIGCCTPRQYEEMFRETVGSANINSYLLEMVNLREQCSYPHFDEPEKALKKAKLLIKGAVNRVKFLDPLFVKKSKIHKEIAVVGAGIAGINASLNLARLGYKVYLIEKEPTIGGKMAQLVKTFPTDDCAMCTLSPKLDEVNKSKNIELISYSFIEDVEKIPEGFKLNIRKKSRFIDEIKCTGCGKCSEICPVNVLNNYNSGFKSFRKAVYKEFPSAVPNIYTIDRRGLPPCRTKCALDQTPQGYIALISQSRFMEAYKVILKDNPLPTVCGRCCNHLCEYECTRGNIDEPVNISKLKRFVTDYAMEHKDELEITLPEQLSKSIGIIGSGPSGLACAQRLGNLGYKVTIYDEMPKPGGMLSYGIPQYRLPEKYLEFDLNNIKKLGVEIKTNFSIGKEKSFEEVKNSHDAIYLAIGLSKSMSLKYPGIELKNIYLGGDFLKDVRLGKAPALGDNVVVIGGGNVAVDTARTALRLGAKKVSMLVLEEKDEMPAIKDEVIDALHEGIEILNRASAKAFIGNEKVEKIECIKVKEIIFDGGIRPVFQDGTEFTINADTVIISIGMLSNTSFLEDYIKLDKKTRIITNHDTMQTSIPNVFAGGDCINGATYIVQAIADGQMAANYISQYLKGEEFTLPPKLPLEVMKKEDVIESWKGFYEKNPVQKPRELPIHERKGFEEVVNTYTEEEALLEAKRCLLCGGCADCRLCETVCEAKCIDYYKKDELVTIEVGSAILATGWEEYDPTALHFGYGRYPNVITQLQLARMIDPIGPTQGKLVRPSDQVAAKRILMIQCVGSRMGEEFVSKGQGKAYCSRVCCMVSVKHAGIIKKYFNKSAEIYICYSELRTFGKGYEEYTETVKEMGVKFLRGIPGEIHENDDKTLKVILEDSNIGKIIEIDVDLVVLSAATMPSDNTELLKKFNIIKDNSGFIKEFHPKIRPADTQVRNVFVAGVAQGPKDIPDTVAQAGCAAASCAGFVGDGWIDLNPMTANCIKELCRACGRCEEGCEFKAVRVNPEKLYAVVEEALCEGCGKCSVNCPTGAIAVRSYKFDQQIALVDGLKV